MEEARSHRHNASLTSERLPRVDQSAERLVGGILTPSTMNQNVLRASHLAESPQHDAVKKHEPNIFFNSLTDREDMPRQLTQVANSEDTDRKSEEKLFRLLYRKKFRLKA